VKLKITIIERLALDPGLENIKDWGASELHSLYLQSLFFNPCLTQPHFYFILQIKNFYAPQSGSKGNFEQFLEGFFLPKSLI